MRRLLKFTSILELTLGVALIFFPSGVLKVLLGMEINLDMEVLARLAGIVYICFALACYPKYTVTFSNQSPAVRAMFVYNFLAAIYLFYLKFDMKYEGVLLLPAAVLHSLITIYFIFAMVRESKSQSV